MPVSSDDIAGMVAGWASRPASPHGIADNALTIDIEDYFQVEAFAKVIRPEDWDRRECRIERNVDQILELFADAGARGTFFTLGWIAQRYPATVRKIVEQGHELASHGSMHRRADSQSRAEFLQDVRDAKARLEDIGGVAVRGYRAASFSVTRKNLWALEALEEAGHRYSSSLYPVRHDLYGMPEAPRFAFYPFASRSFVEIPITSVRRFGTNWPAGGGGYFRLLPYWLSVRNMRKVRRQDGQPCVFYFHPWEIDAEQPRIDAPFKARLRHYTNVGKMAHRLKRLLRDFNWKRLDQIYPMVVS